MTENNKTVIVIGAGASADFSSKKQDETLAEIQENAGTTPSKKKGSSSFHQPQK